MKEAYLSSITDYDSKHRLATILNTLNVNKSLHHLIILTGFIFSALDPIPEVKEAGGPLLAVKTNGGRGRGHWLAWFVALSLYVSTPALWKDYNTDFKLSDPTWKPIVQANANRRVKIALLQYLKLGERTDKTKKGKAAVNGMPGRAWVSASEGKAARRVEKIEERWYERDIVGLLALFVDQPTAVLEAEKMGFSTAYPGGEEVAGLSLTQILQQSQSRSPRK